MSDEANAVSFGEALVDFFPEQADAYGRPLRDIDVFRRYSGGAPTNTAVGLARLGIRTALVTCFARDEMGEYLIKSLRHEGVELLASRTDAGPTSLAFIGWDAGGDRRFAFYRRSGADEQIDLDVVEAHADRIRTATVLVCCSNTLIRDPMASAHRRALEIAAQGNVLVAVDLNLRAHLWPSRPEADAAAQMLLQRARVLKGSLEEVSALVQEREPVAAAQALLTRAPALELACVTLGAAGSAWAHRSGAHGLIAPGENVPVKDTTGAGDAFSAALVAGWLEAGGHRDQLDGDGAARIVRRAVLAGTRAVGFVGATTGMPTRQELDQLFSVIPHG